MDIGELNLKGLNELNLFLEQGARDPETRGNALLSLEFNLRSLNRRFGDPAWLSAADEQEITRARVLLRSLLTTKERLGVRKLANDQLG